MPDRYCECGSRLLWETCGSGQLALCESEDCGQVTLPDGDTTLESALGVSGLRPPTKPWLRLFLRLAARLDEGCVRQHAERCRECGMRDFRFQLSVWRRG